MMKLVVLASGNGTNLQAIIDAVLEKKLDATVEAVITNKSSAYALARARKFHIPALVQLPSEYSTREAYDQNLAELIKKYQPDYIVLAGWMRILTHAFLQHFPDQVINLHPALPEKFPGMNAISRAFEAFKHGEISHTGVMVHYVPDEGVDSGPVILQQIVPIYSNDTEETLTERMHEVEHQLLIQALQQLSHGRIKS